MSKYHPRSIKLHWISAVLIIAQLVLSSLIAVKLHIALGVIIAILTFCRLKTKMKSKSIMITSTAAKTAHFLMYGLIIALIVSGAALAKSQGLATGNDFLHNIHQGLANALTFIIMIHLAAVLYHLVILKDSILQRMWFSKAATSKSSF